MMYSVDEQYEESSTSKLINEDDEINHHHHHPQRSVKAVKSTRSRIIPSRSSIAMHDDHDYVEPPCPSFDLHLYAHIDHSSLNRCVFTPVPHQTVVQNEQSQPIGSRKRKYDSIASTNDYNKNVKFGNDHGELADIIYNMDTRLDDLTRTCNGLRSSIHILTKMVTQLVNNQKQSTSTDEIEEISQIGLPYVRSSSSVSSKTTPNRNRRSRNNTDSINGPRPTEFLCRLIRKVYSTDEIVAGITPDERLERIKGAVADRYFSDDPERFEAFWTREAHQSILGQARAQRCRDKKAGNYIQDNR